MEAIRKMEPAWEKVNGLKFQLVEYRDAKGELRPCYQLTKTECLYIATKFNDASHGARHAVTKDGASMGESQRAEISAG